MLPARDSPQNKRATQTECKGLEKKYSTQTDRKIKTGVAKLISNKIDFKTKAINKTQKDTS